MNIYSLELCKLRKSGFHLWLDFDHYEHHYKACSINKLHDQAKFVACPFHDIEQSIRPEGSTCHLFYGIKYAKDSD